MEGCIIMDVVAVIIAWEVVRAEEDDFKGEEDEGVVDLEEGTIAIIGEIALISCSWGEFLLDLMLHCYWFCFSLDDSL
jgi:hypothetical protein